MEYRIDALEVAGEPLVGELTYLSSIALVTGASLVECKTGQKLSVVMDDMDDYNPLGYASEKVLTPWFRGGLYRSSMSDCGFCAIPYDMQDVRFYSGLEDVKFEPLTEETKRLRYTTHYIAKAIDTFMSLWYLDFKPVSFRTMLLFELRYFGERQMRDLLSTGEFVTVVQDPNVAEHDCVARFILSKSLITYLERYWTVKIKPGRARAHID